jgi:hypothetical protein
VRTAETRERTVGGPLWSASQRESDVGEVMQHAPVSGIGSLLDLTGMMSIANASPAVAALQGRAAS